MTPFSTFTRRIPTISLIIFAALLSVVGLYVRKATRARFRHFSASKSAPRAASPAKVPVVPLDDPFAMPSPSQLVPSTEEEARLLTDFDKAAWGATMQEWSTAHANIHCQAFHGRMWAAEADRQWSYQCSPSRDREAPRWSFYVFGLVGISVAAAIALAVPKAFSDAREESPSERSTADVTSDWALTPNVVIGTVACCNPGSCDMMSAVGSESDIATQEPAYV